MLRNRSDAPGGSIAKAWCAWESGGAPEVVRSGETGVLVERGSVPALANTLRSLLTDGILRRRFGDSGRQLVETAFTPEQMCAQTVGAYRAVLFGREPEPCATPREARPQAHESPA